MVKSKVERVKELVNLLSKASIEYYKYDKPSLTDKQYDDLYDELVLLEKETGVVIANSPTQKVQGSILEGLTKVQHSKLMLSAQKTKDLNDIKQFSSKSGTYASWKLDGLTLVVKYVNGKLQQVLTRGSGDFGEDVTEQARMITNLPLSIPFKEYLELRGECVISWNNFSKINETLEEPYSHPRNLAAGSIRQLNTNIAKDRCLEFVVFEVVNPYGGNNKFVQLNSMDILGFTTVDRVYITSKETVDDIVNVMTGDKSKYPVDGLIFEYTDSDYSKSLGVTSHHESCRMALKWADDTYETVLRDIEWSTSRTGLINPVAIFDPTDLGGAITTRATLHNISYMEDLELGIGDIITVYRANMVIPKVDDNLTRSNTFTVPTKCPICGGDTRIQKDNDSKVLMCDNPDCKGKLLGKLTHFVSKPALNIDGLSEATLEFLINKGWVNSYIDLYSLDKYKLEWMGCEGFGKSSVTKLLEAIEKSKHVKLENFLIGLGIPLIGKTASKTISKYCKGDIVTFEILIDDGFDFTTLEDFGVTMHESIIKWFNKTSNALIYGELAEIFAIINQEEKVESNGVSLNGLTFVITGSVNHFKNRDELKAKIESLNGKVSGSVSAKTNYLINNDITSNSGKNKDAKKLNIPIITEEQFLTMINK